MIQFAEDHSMSTKMSNQLTHSQAQIHVQQAVGYLFRQNRKHLWIIENFKICPYLCLYVNALKLLSTPNGQQLLRSFQIT